MLMKYCNKCGKPIPYPLSYCSECQKIVDEYRAQRLAELKKKSNRRYNARRDPKFKKFYNSVEWRTLSAKVLQDAGYKCVMCGSIATEVDHIEEIQTEDGWNKRLDYGNCRALCHDCHDRRHDRFKRKKAKPHRRG